MSDPKFTAGPWIVAIDPPSPQPNATVAWCSEFQIATLGPSYEFHGTSLADALLIAEAPVMHGLLTEAVDLVPRISDDDPMAPALAEWLRRARESLKRAEDA